MVSDQNTKKKRLLIAYGNPYVFYGIIAPLIPKLSNLFEVFLITINYHLSDNVMRQFESWKKSQTIMDFLIIPVYANSEATSENGLKLHLFMKRNLGFLRKLKFNFCIMGAAIHIWERYIVDCVLPRSCIRIGWWLSGFPFALHPSLVNDFLAGYSAPELVKDLVNPWTLRKTTSLNPYTGGKSLFERIFVNWRELTLAQFTKKALSYLRNKLAIGETINRKLYPRLMVGKAFPLGKWDKATWFDTDRFDIIFVQQRFPELFLSCLYPHAPVFLVNLHYRGVVDATISILRRQTYWCVLVGLMAQMNKWYYCVGT